MERLGWMSVGAVFGASATLLAVRLLNRQDEEEAADRYQPDLGSGRQEVHGAPASKPETGFNAPMSSKPIDQPKSNYTAGLPSAPKTTPK